MRGLKGGSRSPGRAGWFRPGWSFTVAPSKADPEGEVRGKTWVHPNGEVLRQEARFSNATVAFRRLPDERAGELAEQARARSHRKFKGPMPWDRYD